MSTQTKRRRRARRKPAEASRPTLAATERAGLYRLPCGRWRGFSIAQAHERDSGYLMWAARTWDGRLGEVVRMYLAGIDDAPR